MSPQESVIGTANANHDSSEAELLIDSNDNPIVVARWNNNLEGDSVRELWMARWSATGQYFLVHQLAVSPGSRNVGIPHVVNAGSTLIVIFPNELIELSAPFTVDPIVYVLTSDTNGDSWTRFVLDDGTGYGAGSAHFNGVYIDLRAYDVDSVLRVLPLSPDDPDLHEIWEFELPTVAAATGGGGSSISISSVAVEDITANSATVRWNTSLATNNTRLVGEPAPADSEDTQTKTSHEASLDNLSPDTLYSYTIQAGLPGRRVQATASLAFKTPAAPPSASGETLKETQESSATGSENQEIKELLERVKELQLLLIQVAEQLVDALQEQIQAATVPTTL